MRDESNAPEPFAGRIRTRNGPNLKGAKACPREVGSAPDFAAIISTEQERSAARKEEVRKRARAIAEEQQRRWDDGIAFLNSNVRPLLERALQACVEEGLPALVEDNFSEIAATPRLLFYCSSGLQDQDGCSTLGGESERLVLESDGSCLRAGLAKSFSSSPDAMRVCDSIEGEVMTLFSAVLQSYFQSCEQAERYKLASASNRRMI